MRVRGGRRQPVSILGWHIPAARDPDSIAVDALGDVLATGRTSRLYKSLIVDKKIAVEVEAGTGEPGQKYPNLFISFPVPAPGNTIDECVAAVEDELQKVRKEPVSDAELNVVKTRTQANFVRGLRGGMDIAQGLALDQDDPGRVARAVRPAQEGAEADARPTSSASPRSTSTTPT